MSPLEELAEARARARARDDPMANLIALATPGSHVRMMALRAIDASGVGVLAAATSPKVGELEGAEEVEGLVYWPTLARQVRVRGGWRRATRSEEEAWWRGKSPGGRRLDALYARGFTQSQPVARGALEAAYRASPQDPEPPETLWGCWIEARTVWSWEGGEPPRLVRWERRGAVWTREDRVP